MAEISVPKILFTYWSGDTLSLLHILTLRAARLLNPQFKIVIYTAKQGQFTNVKPFSSHEHSVDIKRTYSLSTLCGDVSDVILREIDFFKEYGIENPLFHTFLADIVRIKKLEEHGGVWFDMDLLFVKPLTDRDLSLPKGKTCATVSYSNTIATGFVFGHANAPFFRQLSEKVDEYLRKGVESNFEKESEFSKAYQAFGPDLWRRLAHPHLDENLATHPTIHSIVKECVYPFMWNQMHLLFEENSNLAIGDSSYALHWYNGSPDTRGFINNLDEDPNWVYSKQSPLAKVLKELGAKGLSFTPPVNSEFEVGLRGVNLQDANLQNANFEGVDFRNANLKNANLLNSNLRFADLRGACLTNTNLKGADLFGATFENKAVMSSQLSSVGISIVLASYNRLSQLRNTLYSFSKSAHKNFEVIIVDDASNEDNRIEGAIALGQYDFPIKIVTIKPSEKTWLNPSAAYNIGVTYATKQIVVLQNAEVAFIGDVLSYIARHLNPKDWMTFNCYGLDSSKSEGIRSMIDDYTSAFKTVCKLPNKVGGNSVENKDPSGWLNHYEKHFVAYHYCGAIYKSDLEIYMNGGFSKDFYQLVGADDDEFVKRLLFNMFNFKIGEFKEGTPFVIHQYHEPSEAVSSWSKDKYRETMLAFAKSCIKMGFKPENNIALAPKTEIPMSRRSIVH